MLRFNLRTRLKDRKTDRWLVTNDSNFHLGEVRWHGHWRRYVFAPNDQTVFDSSCLNEIMIFIETRMVERET